MALFSLMWYPFHTWFETRNMHDNHKPALLCDSLPSSGLQHALQVVLVLLLLVFDSWQTVSAGNLSENLSAMWCQCPSDSTEKHQEALSCSVLGMMRKMSTVAFLVFAWLGRSSWSWFLEGRNLKGWRCHSSSAWNLLTLHLSKQRMSDLYWGHVFQFLSKSVLESSLRNRPKEPLQHGLYTDQARRGLDILGITWYQTGAIETVHSNA